MVGRERFLRNPFPFLINLPSDAMKPDTDVSLSPFPFLINLPSDAMKPDTDVSLSPFPFLINLPSDAMKPDTDVSLSNTLNQCGNESNYCMPIRRCNGSSMLIFAIYCCKCMKIPVPSATACCQKGICAQIYLLSFPAN
jgi:hypothetical protein